MAKGQDFTLKGFNYCYIDERLTLGSSLNSVYLNAINDSSLYRRSLVLESRIGKRRVKDIGPNAFRATKANYDDFLEVLEIKEGFERILSEAFRDQYNLKTVIIPESVYQINYAAFYLYNISSMSRGQGTTTFIFSGKSKIRSMGVIALSGQANIIISVAVYKEILADESINYIQANKISIFTPLGTKFFNIKTTASLNEFSASKNETCKRKRASHFLAEYLFIFIFILK